MDREVAARHLETARLMGVDFLPAGGAAAAVDGGDDGDAATQLAALAARHDAACPHCTTAIGYSQTVFGCGSAEAQLMFIGEAPGAEEDRRGEPFVGPAGCKLDQIIDAMGLKRGDVYIANILKSRPPNNRTPMPDEVAACAPFLREQIEIIDPKVIVTLGGPATKFILNTQTGITALRGTWGVFTAAGGDIAVMPTFHPAYLLRNYTAQTRNEVWSDMQQVMAALCP